MCHNDKFGVVALPLNDTNASFCKGVQDDNIMDFLAIPK